jgi:adenylate cyclase
MARRYFTKSLDASAIHAHISPSDYGTEIKLGEHVSHECSVIFFDLNNFTNISWSLTTTQVMSIIQPLFAKASAEITKYGGMVDKFPGDGVVGFFPRHYSNKDNTISDSALDCATKVMYWFYNELRPIVDLPKSSHTLELCCGIDAGTISIAHVGTVIHSELILLGDQVNCASKCQGAAEKKEVIIGQEALNLIHHKGFYSKYLSTGPNIGVVYTNNNDRYLSKRFDWEAYTKEYDWAR